MTKLLLSLVAALAIASSTSVALIEPLHVIRGPSTVVGAVRTFVVFSIKSQTFGAIAHIGEEVFERIEPAVAHCDSSSSVTIPSRIVWIRATPLCSFPRFVCTGERLHVLQVLASLVRRGLFPEAAAARCISRAESVCLYRQLAAARAEAAAPGSSSLGKFFGYCESPVVLAENANLVWHTGNLETKKQKGQSWT